MIEKINFNVLKNGEQLEIITKIYASAFLHLTTKENLKKNIISFKRSIKKQNKDIISTAIFDDKIIGFAVLRIDNKCTLTIKYFAVEPKYQNQSIGSLIIKHIKNDYRNYIIKVKTQIWNKKAINFYLKHGFKVVYEKNSYISFQFYN